MNNDKPESKAPAILKKENFDERFEMHEKLGEVTFEKIKFKNTYACAHPHKEFN